MSQARQRQQRQQQQEPATRGNSLQQFVENGTKFHDLLDETATELLDIQARITASPQQLQGAHDILAALQEGIMLCKATRLKLNLLMELVARKPVATKADIDKLEHMRMTFNEAIGPINNRVQPIRPFIQKMKQQQARAQLQAHRRQHGGAALLGLQFKLGLVPAVRQISPPPLQRLVPTAQDKQQLQLLRLGGRSLITFMRDLENIQKHVQETTEKLTDIATTKLTIAGSLGLTDEYAVPPEDVEAIGKSTLGEIEALRDAVLERGGAVTEADRTRLQDIDTSFNEAIDPLSKLIRQGVRQVDQQQQTMLSQRRGGAAR